MRRWVKICGVRSAADIRFAAGAGADAVGLNFFAGSKRFCPPELARDIVSAAPVSMAVFGVFVDTDRSRIERTIELTGVGGLQLHGDHSSADAQGWDRPVILAVQASSRDRVRRALEEAGAAGSVYRVLLDSPAGGGSGQRWAEETVGGLDLGQTVLAGGLGPANVADVVGRLAPWGVDSASGTESEPGIKDPRLIEEFIANARAA